MKHSICFNTHSDCRECQRTKKGGFRYVESKKGEKFDFISEDDFTIIFILTGKANISCNEFINVPFHAKEMCLLPISAQCVWETVEDATGILLTGDQEMSICDKVALQTHAGSWLNVEEKFNSLKIRPRIIEYLLGIKNYLKDGITCPLMHSTKLREFSILLRAYYTHDEVLDFFLPTVKYNHNFELFIMKNYLKMKGVQEFIDLSGLNVNTFNRKFKMHFGETPYQWLVKQKSKHILHELMIKDKSIAKIMRDFDFSDASHFNRYCKNMFGKSPSEIRKKGAPLQNSNISR